MGPRLYASAHARTRSRTRWRAYVASRGNRITKTLRFSFAHRLVLSQSSGRDGACTETGDWLDQRTASNPHGMASCGQPPWLSSDAVGRLMETLLHIQRTTVPVAVGSGGDHPSRWADCTSCDTLRWPCVGVLAYALRTIRLASGLGIQDVGRAGAASRPWAITSRQNKKPAPTVTPTGETIGTGNPSSTGHFRY